MCKGKNNQPEVSEPDTQSECKDQNNQSDANSEASTRPEILPENLTESWELAAKVLWDEEKFAAGLGEYFRKKGYHKVLDASGGTGFPAIQLAEMGFDVTYNDFNPDMVAHAKKKAEAAGVKMEYLQLDWLRLDETIEPETYDVVICRGNSLVYVATWGNGTEVSFDQGQAGMRKAVEQLAAVVKPGGLLYVDKSPYEHDGSWKVYKESEVEGHAVTVDWTFTQCLTKMTRHWENRIIVDGHESVMHLNSVLLTGEMLGSFLSGAGLLGVDKLPIEGENTYEGWGGTVPLRGAAVVC